RREGGCASTAPFVAIGVVTAPTTTFLDTQSVEGSVTYSYKVASSDSSCAACTSAPSACKSITPGGICSRPPLFDGLQTVHAGAAGQCSLTLGWSAGSLVCSGPLTYSIYRSTSSTFAPSP